MIAQTDTAAMDLTSEQHTFLKQLQYQTASLREKLVDHRLYRCMNDPRSVRIFMQLHVFVVWDFMNLMKWLQIHFTCTQVPWFPSQFRVARRFINEIVLGEESDERGNQVGSHFEMYLEAMSQAGADTGLVHSFLHEVFQADDLFAAARATQVPQPICEFMETTWSTFDPARPHRAAAAMAFGRESLIPEMFTGILRDLEQRHGLELHLFREYLQRHISLDSDRHFPLACRVVADACGNSEVRWQEATEAAGDCLLARLRLWDSIAAAIESSTS